MKVVIVCYSVVKSLVVKDSNGKALKAIDSKKKTREQSCYREINKGKGCKGKKTCRK